MLNQLFIISGDGFRQLAARVPCQRVNIRDFAGRRQTVAFAATTDGPHQVQLVITVYHGVTLTAEQLRMRVDERQTELVKRGRLEASRR